MRKERIILYVIYIITIAVNILMALITPLEKSVYYTICYTCFSCYWIFQLIRKHHYFLEQDIQIAELKKENQRRRENYQAILLEKWKNYSRGQNE